MAQLLDELMCRARVEDVFLNRNVLIVELIEKPEWRRIFNVVIEALLAESLGNVLYHC